MKSTSTINPGEKGARGKHRVHVYPPQLSLLAEKIEYLNGEVTYPNKTATYPTEFAIMFMFNFI